MLTIENRSGRTPAAVRHRLCRVGARARRAGPARAPDRHRARPETRRAARCATRGTPSSAAGSRSSTSAAGRRRGRRIAPSSSAATAPRPARRPRPRAPRCGAQSAPAWTRAPRCRPASSSPTGATTQVVVLLGEADDAAAARRPDPARAAAPITQATLRDVASYWDDALGTIQVRTPDRSMDIMLNRWLLYQTLACRLWARTAFYQAGGAYGFRDQLQDVIALVTAEARARPRAPAAGRGAAVRRRRRPALVASAVGPGRADPDLGRSAVAAVRRRPLPRGHRRHGRARRDRAVPRGTGARAGPDGRLLPAGDVGAVGHAVRALRARRSTAAWRSAPTGCR